MKQPSLLASLLPVSALLVAGVAGVAVPRAEELAPRQASREAPIVAAPVPPARLAPNPVAEVGDEVALPEPQVAPEILPAPPLVLGERRLDPAIGRYVAPLGEGRAILTLDPLLQEKLERSLSGYRVAWGATVMLEVGSGRVLALAEHSQDEPARKSLALSALAPAASLFKIVTATALLERGVGAQAPVCYHGGRRRLQPKLLTDDPRRDRRCVSLADAFGHSTNVVFAKLADRDLDAKALRATAARFLFNVPIDFPRTVEPSRANIPDDPFGLANTAAGFGDVKLSPLHAALLASVVANGGLLVPPVLVDGVAGVALPAPPAPWRVVDEAVASELGDMMRSTVSAGTARRAFRRAGAAMRGVSVAGKTGSLSDPSPFRDYSWFIGYAPAENPEVVVATVVANGRLWHARAPTVAREALEAFFAARVARVPPGAVSTARAP